MDKTVSVIMPVYSYARFLDEAIPSVLNQTIKAHEIIVVSDGAIDNSVEVASKYPVRIIEKVNGGLSSARNAGIKEATGKYIVCIDGDDIMKPNFIEEHLKLMDEKSIVTCGLMAFGSESYTARPQKATIPILLKTNVIYSNSMFPKQAWIDVGGYDECELLRYGWEDREFWLRCLAHGYESKVSMEITMLYRRHGEAMSFKTANPHHKELQDYIYNKNIHLLK